MCNKFTAVDLRAVLRHIGSVHSFEPGFLITCGVSGCARTYHNFRSFQKHVSKDVLDKALQQSCEDEAELSVSDCQNEFDEVEPEIYKPDLQRSAALLKAKEVGRLSQAALNLIVEGVTELFQAHCGDQSRPFQGLETEYLQQQYFKHRLNMWASKVYYDS